jgi:hypothetical protein
MLFSKSISFTIGLQQARLILKLNFWLSKKNCSKLNILDLLPGKLCTIPIKKSAAIWAGELMDYREQLGYGAIDPKQLTLGHIGLKRLG